MNRTDTGPVPTHEINALLLATADRQTTREAWEAVRRAAVEMEAALDKAKGGRP